MSFDFAAVGGIPLVAGAGAPPLSWNFGLVEAPDASKARPTFAQAAPNLMDRWDGKTSISLFEVVKKLLGKDIAAQRQTRGTCVSRGWSLACNLLQAVQIVNKRRPDKFMYVSHSVIYGGSREMGGMLGGGDGSYGGAAADWVRKGGLCTQEEVGDNYTDDDTDTLAVKFGSRGVPDNLKKLAIDNLVGETALVTTYEEAANAIASGKPVPVCSGQGFTMTRDADGFCRPSGSWAHCMLFGAVIVLPNGKRGLGCAQSWGQNTPSGLLLPGCPDFVFGVDEETATRMLSGRDSFAITGLNGWEADTIPWTF